MHVLFLRWDHSMQKWQVFDQQEQWTEMSAQEILLAFENRSSLI